MAVAAHRRERAGAAPGVPGWPALDGVIAILGAVLVSVLAAIVAAVVVKAAGSDGQTGFGTLVLWAIAAPGIVWVVVVVARRTEPPTAAELGLRTLSPDRVLRVLGAAVVVFAAVVALWSLVVDLDAALSVPAEVATGELQTFIDPDGADAVGLSANALALVLALGVVAPIGIEVLLRGFVLPALSSWRGTLPAVAVVCVLGAITAAADGALLPCVIVLQLLLCALYLLTGSLLPGIALSAGAAGLALAAAFGWTLPAMVVVSVACAALASAVAVGVARRG